jgi:hypothetical protein
MGSEVAYRSSLTGGALAVIAFSDPIRPFASDSYRDLGKMSEEDA